MRAGTLKDQVVIQRATESIDAFGQPVKTWANLATVRAHVRHVGIGSEIEESGKIEARAVVEFSIRYTDVLLTDRIVWNSQNFDVIEIRDIYNENRQLKIKAVTDG